MHLLALTNEPAGQEQERVSPAPDDSKPSLHAHVAGSASPVPALELEKGGQDRQLPAVALKK